ncbi:MAG: molybdopterin molybdenumtransferase MoeA [Deltaproteobacteria bacterium]|nr:molybdopterin molybdenumtransferase MoeA [Deltaproteobacteria bacterium]MBI2365955.1 molybdopterin molybdenumtransferase MoeA [Deltaproteobacteria bacterium]MBI3064083.1 molybdopterin molybdenumtransferase MoeA [Deltaproteobacteria bacterium]
MAQTFFKVLAPQEALRLLLAVESVGTEPVPTIKARARVLAEDLYSAVDLPHFHRAAMDGYAVKAKDTFGASQSLPAYLKLAGVVEMGKEATQALNSGEAIRISTGGMMPPQADAVVMVEYTDETDAGLVEIHRGVSPWQNVIQIGDDIKQGEPVFQRGRRLKAHDLGALTGVGISSVPVYKRPRVGLISTGDEIVDADTEPRPGQVRNINQHSLAGLIEECGGELKDWGVIRDDRGDLSKAIGEALEWGDLVLLSGGSSMGAKDIALETILSFPDSEFIFHGISIAPGKPTIFARACGKPILGLPGYPVSALVIFDLFGAPLIRRLGGESAAALQRFSRSVRAKLKTNIASQLGREDYVRVTLERQSDRLIATPLPSKSGAIFTLVKADGMVRIEMNQDGLEQGEEVEVILF